MVENSIFASTSFAMLATKNSAAAAYVQQTYNFFQNQDLKNETPGEQPVWNVVEIFHNRVFLDSSIELYGKKLENTNPHAFAFMNESQRAALIEELQFAFYIFSGHYVLNKAEDRQQVLSGIGAQIKQCALHIHALQQVAKPQTPQTILETESNTREKYEKFLGIAIGRFIGENMVEFSEGKTVVLKEWMGAVNSKRLYWVWGGSLVSTIISMLPDTFAGKDQAQTAVAFPQPFTGGLSWLLYYARFGVNLSLLLKHTIAGPWMSQAEKQIPWTERFSTQWQQRKFSLLNDSIWATCNLACFFWLTGNGILGYYGNVFTAGLLLMDVCLNTWGYLEETTKNNALFKKYEDEVSELKATLNALLQDKDSLTNNAQKISMLREQILHLEQLRRQFTIDWKYKKYKIINDLTYSIALLAAFAVVCCFFFPPSAILPATAAILGLVGAALCFVCTVATSGVAGYLDIAKINESQKERRMECDSLLKLFKNEKDENQKKFLFLEIKRLLATSETQDKQMTYQKLMLCKEIFIKAFFPALVFSAFVFFPLNIGIGILAAAASLAVVVQLMIDKYKPGEKPFPSFNDGEYQQFLESSDLNGIKTIEAPKNGFFKPWDYLPLKEDKNEAVSDVKEFSNA